METTTETESPDRSGSCPLQEMHFRIPNYGPVGVSLHAWGVPPRPEPRTPNPATSTSKTLKPKPDEESLPDASAA